MHDKVCELSQNASTTLHVKGALVFDTVSTLAQTLPQDIKQVDLSGVTAIDSAGLALLINWINFSQQSDLKFVKIPPQVIAIINMRGLGEVFNANRTGEAVD